MKRKQNKPQKGPKRNALRWLIGVGAILVALVVVVFTVGLTSPSTAQPDVGHRPGNLAPDFMLPSLSGEGELRLADFHGEGVVLNFFAAWCPPCWKELPYFQQASEEFKDQGVRVIGIGIQDERSTLENVVSTLGLTFPAGYDPGVGTAIAYGLRGMPTTVFIDRSGVIRQTVTGELNLEQIRELVRRHLL